jgi:S1-C subfamily serine protease
VIKDSPADQAGIQAGDTALGYSNQRIFELSDLTEATSAGERGEYVQVDLIIDNEPLSLLIPRGPMDVRLEIARDTQSVP